MTEAEEADKTVKAAHVEKPTRNTKAWWQDLTKWTDDEFEERRKAIITRIREKWPEESMLSGRNQKHEVRQWLQPLVSTFDDSNWLERVKETDRSERQLSYYTSWAFYLNRSYRVPNPPVTTPTYSFIQPEHILPSVNKCRRSLPHQQSDYWSESTNEGTVERRLTKSEQSTEPPYASRDVKPQAFDWDNVDVKIDASHLGLGDVWLPMYDLKPVPKDHPCHWSGFELTELYKQFTMDTGQSIDPATHEFVYSVDTETFKFHRQGAYKIVLRRFSHHSTAINLLPLVVQHRTRSDVHLEVSAPRNATKVKSPQHGIKSPSGQAWKLINDWQPLHEDVSSLSTDRRKVPLHAERPTTSHSANARGTGRSRVSDFTIDSADESSFSPRPAKRLKHAFSPERHGRTARQTDRKEVYSLQRQETASSDEAAEGSQRDASRHTPRHAEKFLFSQTDASSDDEQPDLPPVPKLFEVEKRS